MNHPELQWRLTDGEPSLLFCESNLPGTMLSQWRLMQSKISKKRVNRYLLLKKDIFIIKLNIGL